MGEREVVVGEEKQSYRRWGESCRRRGESCRRRGESCRRRGESCRRRGETIKGEEKIVAKRVESSTGCPKIKLALE